MRLHRFYIQTSITENSFDISDRELVHQWRSVFRYNVGSQVILFDGSGMDFLCIISSLRNLGATVGVLQKSKSKYTPTREVWLCVGIIKKDNFEMVVEKATELGVTHIVPILCERTEKKNLNMGRLQKIAVEASEQSGRGDITQIHQVATLSEVLQHNILLPDNKICLHTKFNSDESGNFQFSISNFQKEGGVRSIAVFIGPEGGFSDAEIKQFTQQNIPVLSLGLQTLRTETAAVAVASLLLL